MKRTRKTITRILAIILSIIMLIGTVPVFYAAGETLENGYTIDMDNIPKVHFADHPEWEDIYNNAWEIHKSNIKKIGTVVNPEDVYFMDEAFNNEIYAWDTMFMMLFDKYGSNEFPTLESLDNFYYSQYDSENYSVGEVAGTVQQGTVINAYYNQDREHNNNGVYGADSANQFRTADINTAEFVADLNKNVEDGLVSWKNGEKYPVFDVEPSKYDEAVSFSGSGTENDPYLITGAGDMAKLAEQVNSGVDNGAGKFYKLVSDISYSERNSYMPIGTDSNRFEGTFDGDFHTISGIDIKTEEATQGLFGFVYNGTIKNVIVDDMTIYSAANSGGIAGQAKGNSQIINCAVTNSFIHTEDYAVGGICGLLEDTGMISGCYVANGDFRGRGYVGGIAGLLRNGSPSIKNCYSDSDVIFNGDGYIFRKRYESNGTTYYDYTDVLGLNPPLWAWAEWEQYQIHGDITRFEKEINGKTIYQRLIDHFNFIEREKKMENGLYGKTSGDANGFDDTPNQDYPWTTATGGKGEQTYNDLSIQQAQFAYYLSLIADELGDTETGDYFMKKHDSISTLINELMWDENAKMYSNLDTDGVTHTNISTPTNLWSLVGRVATEDRADAIIKNHALNSEKLFRPNGLSTSAYDYKGDSSGRSAYSPLGKYWNGSIWAPASYQYIKGLQEQGYTDLAFQEGIRHINLVSETYEKGYNGIHSIWECYSPDYIRPATTKGDTGNSRYNFVGWTGCLAIGVAIEELIGLDVSGPNNTVTWTPHLTEENGISGLWYGYQGTTNKVDILAKERASAESAVTFTVKAERPFTLIVNNNKYTEEINVEAGTHEYTVPAYPYETIPRDPAYLDVKVQDITGSKGIVTKEFIESGIDYAIFAAEENNEVTDGLKYRTTVGNGYLYNVNTVGYRAESAKNPVQLRDSQVMIDGGFENAKELVRKRCNVGNDGFMLMAKADTEMKTMYLTVGVKNATGMLNISISDASQPEVKLQLEGGNEEKVYTIQIPYRAASAEKNIYVEYLIPSDSDADAEISLKSAVVYDGGETLPKMPVNVTAEAGDKLIKVNAEAPEGEKYTAYSIYVTDMNGNTTVRDTESMPFVIEGLCNNEKYSIKVEGVKDGLSGRASDSVTAIPEAAGTTDEDRAEIELDRAISEILGSNSDFDSITSALNMSIQGKVYSSEITVSSSTRDMDEGIMADGSVIRSFIKDIPVELTITSICNGTSVARTIDAAVKAIDFETEPFVSGSSYPYAFKGGKVDLTSEGSKDWVQFSDEDYMNYARKATEQPSITNFKHLDNGYTEVAGDVPMSYVYTDAAEGIQPNNLKGIVSKFIGNGFEFNLPYCENMQKVNIYAGVYRAKGKIELLVNDKVYYTDYVSKNDTSLNLDCFRMFEINFKAVNPDDEIKVRYTMTESYVTSGNGGSLILPVVTLSETDEQFIHSVGSVNESIVQAENYISKGTQAAYKEPCGDTNGGLSIGGVGAGESLRYIIDVEKTGVYDLALRMAAASARQQNITVLLDDSKVVGSMEDVVSTGGWQTYADYLVENVVLVKGRHILTVRFGAAGANLNYVKIISTGRELPEFSVMNDDEALTNEYFNVSFTTRDFIEKPVVRNESGAKIGYTVKSITENFDGTFTLEARMKVGTPGDNRTFTVYDGVKQLGTFSIKINAVVTDNNYVSGSSYPFEYKLGQINLTEEGTTDWAQFCTKNDDDYARKATEQPSITNFKHIDASYTEAAGDVPMSYTYTDAAEGTQPSGKNGIVSKFEGNGFEFELPYSVKMQKVNIYAGVWRANGKVELLINDKVYYTDYVSNSGSSLSLDCFRQFEINFKAEKPTDKIKVRYTMENTIETGGRGGSIILPAVTLSDTEEPQVHCVDSENTLRVEAEHYYAKKPQSSFKQPCGDVEGGLNIGGIAAGTELTYNIDVEKSGEYSFNFRLASQKTVAQSVSIVVDGEKAGSLSASVATGVWQTYNDYTAHGVRLEQGLHKLSIVFSAADTNFNYFEIAPVNIDATSFKAVLPEKVIKNQKVQMGLTTDENYSALIIKNEQGKKISAKILEKVQNEDGSYSSVVEMSFGTVRSDGMLTIYDGNKRLGTCPLSVLDIPDEIYDVALYNGSGTTVKAGEEFMIKAVTTRALIKGKLETSDGKVIGTKPVVEAKVVDGDRMTSIYRVTIGTAGSEADRYERGFVFKADYDKRSDFPFEYPFILNVEPQMK